MNSLCLADAIRRARPRLAGCLLLLSFLRPTSGATPVPQPLSGWSMELVAEAPKLRHPSVVCSAPDGRLFVAEDPMDISTPRADATEGRILCLDLAGRVTVFAEKLHAVFGMQYLDGKLYVLHNPRFSVFTDDHGIATDRTDLIEQTNPNPWALDWNDHVPANFRLGIDGWLYVAVGDKGIYGAVGRDGKRVDLHGGGILRLRPDGTALEVFCHGVRNILDVAMNAEDELFTFDNTDEQQWMGRVTHMVDGGFYGYPYDFIPRRPYTLWMLADYGAGAATGTVCYNEDALPPEYQGNLFLADFGKRQVMRVRVERDGGSFRAVERMDLFPNPPPDFRPVGITWAADGMSLFICDWAHRDSKADITVGRLWKLTHTGASQAAPKPGWFVAAAQGDPFQATQEGLVAALSHPSHAVRMTAQRRLAERGRASTQTAQAALASTPTPTPTPALVAVLTHASAPSHARWHALWTLDAIDGGRSARGEILRLVGDPDLSLRRQAIRQLGNRRVANAVEPLVAQLGDADATVRFQAATALGRIASPRAIAPLLAALSEPDVFTRYAVFTALNRIGRGNGAEWPAIAQGLENRDPAVREGTGFALRDTFEPELVSELARRVRDRKQPDATREAALRLLASLHHQRAPWHGEWWAYHPVNSPPPEKTVEWKGTSLVLEILKESLPDDAAALRLAAIQGVHEARHAAASPILRERFSHEPDLEVRRATIAALGELRDVDSVSLIESLLKQAKPGDVLVGDAILAASQLGGERLTRTLMTLLAEHSAQTNLALPAIRALGRMKSPEAAGLIAGQLLQQDPEIRAAAADALAHIGSEAALKPTLALLDHPSVEVRRSALSAAGRLRTKTAIPDLLKAYSDPEVRVEALSALAQVPDIRALDAYLSGLANRNAALRESCRKAVASIRAAALPLVEQRLDALASEIIAELRALYRTDPAARNSRLFALTTQTLEPADYAAYASTNRGDAGRGLTIFQDEGGVACIKCHVVEGRGGRIGPDLSNAGTQFARELLIESILEPSKVVREGYQQAVIELGGDDSVSGLFRGETTDELQLLDQDGQLRRIPKSEIKGRRMSELSMMPEGLQAALSLQDFADLVAYLAQLNGTLQRGPRASPDPDR